MNELIGAWTVLIIAQGLGNREEIVAAEDLVASAKKQAIEEGKHD